MHARKENSSRWPYMHACRAHGSRACLKHKSLACMHARRTAAAGHACMHTWLSTHPNAPPPPLAFTHPNTPSAIPALCVPAVISQHWFEMMKVVGQKAPGSAAAALTERQVLEPLISYFSYGLLRPAHGVTQVGTHMHVSRRDTAADTVAAVSTAATRRAVPFRLHTHTHTHTHARTHARTRAS
eukprot:360945-Chlamydomonas_euryale.AAC.2